MGLEAVNRKLQEEVKELAGEKHRLRQLKEHQLEGYDFL